MSCDTRAKDALGVSGGNSAFRDQPDRAMSIYSAVEPVTATDSYLQGTVLKLTVDWAGAHCPAEEPTLFTIVEVFPIALSPVMMVQWETRTGESKTGVLKFFDRRASKRFRGSHAAEHSPSIEAYWARYIMSGQGPELFKYCQQMDYEDPGWRLRCFDVGQPTVDTWETTAKKEGEQQHRALDFWQREVKAYERLKDLQGKCIPTFYGSTSFITNCPPGSDPQFFQVGGILVQHIVGFSLDDVFDITELSPDIDWQALCQRAADTAAEINKRGVIHGDCEPRNMVVERSSMQPFAIDFTMCNFEEEYEGEGEHGWNSVVIEADEAFGFAAGIARSLNRRFKLGIELRKDAIYGRDVYHSDE